MEDKKQIELIRKAMAQELAIMRRALLTVEEAGLFLGTSPATIKSLVENERKFEYKYFEGKKRISKSDLLGYINQL